MADENGSARCPGCRRGYLPGPGDARLLEVSADGTQREVSAASLAAAMKARGGPGSVPAAGQPYQEARVRFRRATTEDPIRHQGRLLGFTERLGRFRDGVLRLNATHLRIVPDPSRIGRAPSSVRGPTPGSRRVSGGMGPAELVWALEDLQAIQASSSSVQFSPADGGVVLLRFVNESPRRWEDLLRSALRARWKVLGRGSIVEFQPRIRVR